jgi:uncharacterized protein (DUF488 family)
MLMSVGHSNRTLAQFVSILQAHKIDVLIDVRGGRAMSSTFPHFNTENLAIEIPAVGIEYDRFAELGGRRSRHPGIDPLINGAWELPAFKNYADYAYTSDAFDHGIEKLLFLSNMGRVAFMCSEAVPWRCHRSIVSDYLMLVHNQDIKHITSEKQVMAGRPKSYRTHSNECWEVSSVGRAVCERVTNTS